MQIRRHTKKDKSFDLSLTCARGFEPPTFWSVARRSIQLSYAHLTVNLAYSVYNFIANPINCQVFFDLSLFLFKYIIGK